MNDPKKLNGWTGPMMLTLRERLLQHAKDPETKVLILTGADPYYCAGVNLSAAIQPMHPRKLHGLIRTNNQAVFDAFLDFPKPIIIAANGPAIGACVTSASLCDAIVASEKVRPSPPLPSNIKNMKYLPPGDLPGPLCQTEYPARGLQQCSLREDAGPEGRQ